MTKKMLFKANKEYGDLIDLNERHKVKSVRKNSKFKENLIDQEKEVS